MGKTLKLRISTAEDISAPPPEGRELLDHLIEGETLLIALHFAETGLWQAIDGYTVGIERPESMRNVTAASPKDVLQKLAAYYTNEAKHMTYLLSCAQTVRTLERRLNRVLHGDVDVPS